MDQVVVNDLIVLGELTVPSNDTAAATSIVSAIPHLVLGSVGSFQAGGFGSYAGSLRQECYFGTTTGPVDITTPAKLVPCPPVGPGIVFINQGPFIEDIISSDGSYPANTQGAPGWRVPIAGKYKISISLTVDAQTGGAGSTTIGVGYPIYITLGYAINGSAVMSGIVQYIRQWQNPPIAGELIRTPLSAFIVLDLLPTDILYVGAILENYQSLNAQTGITLENGRLEILYVGV
jgi:hypothetical protein